MQQLSESVLILLVFALLAGCANFPRPYLATQCYLGMVDEETKSYTQVCFVGPEDPRGKFLYYSESVVGASRKARKLLCKQEFVYTRADAIVTIESKSGACGVRGDFQGSTRYTILDGMKFDAEITSCRFLTTEALSCDHPNSNAQQVFQKLTRR